MKDIIFDVGANVGSSTLQYAIDNSDKVNLYAFEPVPQSYDTVVKKANGLSNVFVFKTAVSDFNGKANFNVSHASADHAASSLFEYSDKLETNWGPVKHHFEVTEQIEVDVIRLDAFIEEHGIEYITYFHCDTQGSDLNVLKGMGDHIHKIKEGVVEAAIKYNALYKNQVMIDTMMNFLVEHNFEIVAVQANDAWQNEANIIFRNRNQMFNNTK
jgi:FkbM family methyltransferase